MMANQIKEGREETTGGTHVMPRETSSAANSEEKRLFSQASLLFAGYGSRGKLIKIKIIQKVANLLASYQWLPFRVL